MITNANRAFAFRKALEEFAVCSGEEVENEAQRIQRLLSGLLHYCRIDKSWQSSFVIELVNSGFMLNLKEMVERASDVDEKAALQKLIESDGKIDPASIPDSIRKFMPQK